MPVVERLMLPGSWSMRLRDDTPPSVLDVVDLATAAFGHVVVTPARFDVNDISGFTLLASVARYTGILRARPSQFELAGVGLAAWLGDEDGKGDVLETALTKTAGTFVQWVTDLRPVSLDVGTYNVVAGSLTHTFINQSRRAALDYVCDYFGAEWRIKPSGDLDAGTAAQLFVTTPTAVVQRRSGGRDLNINGITAELDTASDMEDYTTRVVLLGSAGSGSADISPATTYRDMNGNLVDWTRLIESHDTKAGNENAVAQAQLNRFTAQRRAVTLSADAYDLRDDVEAGDTIYVYDPDLDLIDTANQVEYRGEVLFPIKLRVRGVTWPLKRGMGVYFRAPDSAGTLTDLTDWIAWETGTTQVEVGATPRSSGTGVTPAQGDVALGAWTAYTPANTNVTVGNGTLSAAYRMIDPKTCAFRWSLTFGSTTSIGGTVRIGLPFAAAAICSIPGWLLDTPNRNYLAAVRISAAGDADGQAVTTETTGAATSVVDPDNPAAAWSTGDIFAFSGIYEIQ